VPPKKPKPARTSKAVGRDRRIPPVPAKPTGVIYPDHDQQFRPEDAIVAEGPEVLQPSRLAYRDDARGLWLYHGDCLEVMDTLHAKHPGGVFDMIFADPPYFLSNGGITCHAGKMVKVDKGAWDKSRGPELNHEFNTEWLRRCQALLKPNGTLWVSGTHHVIFSVGYAMQQLGMKLLNQVTWQKPNPPPNLACRYFTHSTETILWAAKNEKSRHRFNYADMKRANSDKQMKDVWTFTAPKPDEKLLGKHPTQKPVALLERIVLTSTAPGDLVLDPFMGSGTTALVCALLARTCVGIERDSVYLELTVRRLDSTAFNLAVRINVFVQTQNDLELVSDRIDPIPAMSTEGAPKTDCIFHESKFVFLSCAHISQASVVHTTVDVTLQEAWAHAPDGKKRQTTHIIRCETEILRLKSN
jgi:site-specific DNA-methyltransferase (adenine-specific)